MADGYINQFLIGWKQNIRTEYVRDIPIGHKKWKEMIRP